MCINVLYVLVPVLVHVLLDGSGHDSAEIDGTVERHATSAPSKQPVPAPRHSTKPSTKAELRLELGDASRIPSHGSTGKGKTFEQQQLSKSAQEAHSPSKSSPKSKIPVKAKRQTSESEEPPVAADSLDMTVGSTVVVVASESPRKERPAPRVVSRTVRCITKEYTDGELTKETIEESELPKDAIQTIRADLVIGSGAEVAPSTGDGTIEQVRRTTTTTVTTGASSVDPTLDPEKLEELLKTGGIVETVRTVTLTADADARLEPMTREEVVQRINQVASALPSEIFDFGDKSLPDSSTTTIKTDRSTADGGTVQTVTTVQRMTMEMPEVERSEKKVVRTVITSSGGYEDVLKRSLLEERIARPEVGDTASWVAAAAATTAAAAGRPLTKDEKSEMVWQEEELPMSKRQEERQPDPQWESSRFSQDTSPGSGNGDVYAAANNNNNSGGNANNKNGRHEVHSDTDSDGSPQPRRRSPSKRRTLGSSSGSDVALHEGAELSPLEDDQGTALSQLNLLSKQCTYPLCSPYFLPLAALLRPARPTYHR